MDTAYHRILHLLGAGCIAACLVIVGTKGDLNLHWSGWIAVAFFAVLALGILRGWFPWRGKPLRVMLKGVYVMSALALIGFGFSRQDLIAQQPWIALAPVGAAIVLRIVFKLAFRKRGGANQGPAAPVEGEQAPRRTTHDVLFG